MDLTEQIRARIRAGRLPPAHGYRLYGGKGDGSVCACCDRLISSAEIQFNVECPLPKGGWSPLPMHLNCFHTWRSASIALMQRTLTSDERESRLDASR